MLFGEGMEIGKDCMDEEREECMLDMFVLCDFLLLLLRNIFVSLLPLICDSSSYELSLSTLICCSEWYC